METLKLSKGFRTALSGMPDLSLIHLPEPETLAVSAMDIPFIRPKLLVKEGEPVKIGTPVFLDKRNPRIQYVSPGFGRVKKIVFGPRRKLIEVVIELSKKTILEEDTVLYDPVDEFQMPKSDLVRHLQLGGLWQCFRQFPSKDTADENHEPPMIIVSMNGNDLFSPHPALVLDNHRDLFKTGLKLLKRWSDRIVVTAKETSLDRLAPFKEVVTHLVSDHFPSWDPGVVLYQLKESVEDNQSWCISAEHLVMVTSFLQTGRYPTERVLTVTRPVDKKPHIIARQGAPIKDIVGNIEPSSLVTTGRFNGRCVDIDSHLGFFESTLNIIEKGNTEEFFGFMMPGFTKTSISRTFASRLIPTKKKMDCNVHGEERACINCGYCTRICPVDLMPNFIMKALHSDDIEDALDLGLLDCVRCGLCSYTCPSKIELTHLLSQGMDAYYKDKE